MAHCHPLPPVHHIQGPPDCSPLSSLLPSSHLSFLTAQGKRALRGGAAAPEVTPSTGQGDLPIFSRLLKRPPPAQADQTYSEYLAQVLQGLFQVLVCLLDAVLAQLIEIISAVGAIHINGAKPQPGEKGPVG